MAIEPKKMKMRLLLIQMSLNLLNFTELSDGNQSRRGRSDKYLSKYSIYDAKILAKLWVVGATARAP